MQQIHTPGIYEKYIKRLLDIVCSGLALLVLSPVMLATALVVRTRLGSPVLFTQDRPGLNEKVFKMYKFRTMTDARDAQGNLLPDEVRLTKTGKLLRSLSLDELPELFNILKGDMSLIGPRPLLVKYLPLYDKVQRRRHDVRPGLSGWAQVHGRNCVDWEERFRYDVEYVQKISFGMDLKILFMTIAAVFKREGISSGTSVTMEEFTGKKASGEMK